MRAGTFLKEREITTVIGKKNCALQGPTGDHGTVAGRKILQTKHGGGSSSQLLLDSCGKKTTSEAL